jgi:lactate racemase
LFTEIKLPYGSSFLTASVPTGNISRVLKRNSAQSLADEKEAVLAALGDPVDCRPLRDCIEKNTKAVILVTDNTRPCPDNRLLPVILSELEQKIPRRNITIIVAVGLHPPLSLKELEEKLGKNIIRSYRVMNHDINQVTRIGTTSRGTPVEVNRWVLEADFRLSTGFIEPHFFAGFSGGCKSIAPGVSGPASIRHNHGFSMIDHPLARAGVLQGNPVYEDIVEQAKMAGLNFIVNVLLDENKEMTHVFAGDPVKAHQKGCEVEKSIAGCKVSHKADITITTNGGRPLDMDLYQTCKGIDSASLVTRDGGIIIIASSCSAGVGPEAFRQLHASALSPGEVLQKIRDTSGGVEWQNQLLARTQITKDVYLVSELDAGVVKDMKMTPVRSIEDGLEKAFRELGNNSEVIVIPEGPLVLPLVED